MKKIWLYRIFLGFIGISGLLTLGLMFFIEPKLSSVLDEFMLVYQGEIRKFFLYLAVSLVSVLTLSSFGIFISTFLADQAWKSKILSVENGIIQRKVLPYFSGAFIIILLVSGQLIFQAGSEQDPAHQLFLQVSSPWLVWMTVLSLAIWSWMLMIKRKKIDIRKPSLWIPIVIFGFLSCTLVLFAAMGLGHSTSSDLTGNFDLTGYPILGYQLGLSCGLVAVGLFGQQHLRNNSKLKVSVSSWAIDLAVVAALSISAYLVWMNIPLKPHMFWDQPRPPNYAIYPNSDAMLYDRTAHQLLTAGKLETFIQVGREWVVKRPLLTLFYSGLHALSGPNYYEIINLQVGVFSLLPGLIYLFTSSLHSRWSGLLAALLLLFREVNGLLLGDVVTGVHTKLIMSEKMTLMGVIGFLTLLMHYLKDPESRKMFGFFTGGILGLTMLIRQEVGIMLPFALIPLVLWKRKNLWELTKIVGIVGVGVILTITPWITRNWHRTGELFLDQPGNRLNIIRDTFLISRDQQGMKPGESAEIALLENPFSSDSLSAFSGEISEEAVFLSGPVSPFFTAARNGEDLKLPRILADHFANQMIQSIVYLPSYIQFLDIDFISKGLTGRLSKFYGGLLYHPQAYVKELPFWWNNWEGGIPLKSLPAVAANLFLISYGIYAIWNNQRSLALIPWLAFLGHLMIFTLIRRSGGRFIQEVDWIAMVFLSVGLVEGLNRFLKGSLGKESRPEKGEYPSNSTGRRPSIVSWITGAVVLVVLGSLPVGAEIVIGSNVQDLTGSNVSAEPLANMPSGLTGEEQEILTGFVSSGGEVFLGKALYPRYFKPGEDLIDLRKAVAGGIDRYQAYRTEFFLAGHDPVYTVVFQEKIPDTFPHESGVMVIGCERQGDLDALLVVIHGLSTERTEDVNLIWREGNLSAVEGCPLPETN